MKNSQELRIVLVGLGNICLSAHIPLLKRINAVVSYAVDVNDKALLKVQKIFPTVKVTNNLEVIDNTKVDCAIVASPTGLHYLHVKELISKGVHVFCEKPLATTRQESEEVLAKARKNKLILQVGYYRRFQKATQFIKKILQTNNLGELNSCMMLAGHIFSSSDTPPSLMDKKLSGGGVVMDFGVHALDTLKFWFDDLYLEDYHDDSCGGLEANAVLKLKGMSNATIVPIYLFLSRACNIGYYTYLKFKNCGLIYHFNTGHKVKLISGPVEIFEGTNYLTSDVGLENDHDYLYYFEKQWAEFTQRIEGGPEKVSDLDDALITTSLVESCYEERKSLKLSWEKIISNLNL